MTGTWAQVKDGKGGGNCKSKGSNRIGQGTTCGRPAKEGSADEKAK